MPCWAGTVVRVVTAPGPLLTKGTVSTNGGPPRAMSRSELVQMSWLVVCVLVAFTIAQSAVAFHIAGSAGLRAGPWALAAMAAGFFACHGFDVALRWVALGDRHRASDLASDPLKRFVNPAHQPLGLGSVPGHSRAPAGWPPSGPRTAPGCCWCRV